jgi:hypothetical protein
MAGEFLQPGESIQRQQRAWSDDFTDQHGRRFAAQYDIRNSRPIGELAPVGFTPPWLPPMGKIKWERREGGFRFRWDYETMANELAGDESVYYASVMEFMLEHMPGQPIPEVGEAVPNKVLRSPLGKPPLSSALPLAAAAGEPWILGTPGAPVNEVLKAIIEQSTTSNGRQALNMVRERMAQMTAHGAVPTIAPEVDPLHVQKRTINDVNAADLPKVSYPEFLAECMSRGMKQAAAILAWQEHKKQMEQAA